MSTAKQHRIATGSTLRFATFEADRPRLKLLQRRRPSVHRLSRVQNPLTVFFPVSSTAARTFSSGGIRASAIKRSASARILKSNCDRVSFVVSCFGSATEYDLIKTWNWV
jgi:hypothetical protein